MYRKGVVDSSPMSSRAASQGLIPGYFKYAPRVSRNDATETGELDEAEKEELGEAVVKHQNEPQQDRRS